MKERKQQSFWKRCRRWAKRTSKNLKAAGKLFRRLAYLIFWGGILVSVILGMTSYDQWI